MYKIAREIVLVGLKNSQIFKNNKILKILKENEFMGTNKTLGNLSPLMCAHRNNAEMFFPISSWGWQFSKKWILVYRLTVRKKHYFRKILKS